MRTRGLSLLTATLALSLTGCIQSPMPPREFSPVMLACYPPPSPRPGFLVAHVWYCQVASWQPPAEIKQHRTGQYPDLIVSKTGSCPDRAGLFTPNPTVGNISPAAPAGPFWVEADITVVDKNGVQVVSGSAFFARVTGLAQMGDPAGGDTKPVNFANGVSVQGGDMIHITFTADPQQGPSGPFFLWGEVLELDETNNTAEERCTVPSG